MYTHICFYIANYCVHSIFWHCLTLIIMYTQMFRHHLTPIVMCTHIFDPTWYWSLCILTFLTPPNTDHSVHSFFFFSLSNSNTDCYIHSQVWPCLILIIMLTQILTLPNTDRYVHSHFWHHLTCIIMYTHILYTAQYWSLCPLTFCTLPNTDHYVHSHFWHCLWLIIMSTDFLLYWLTISIMSTHIFDTA